MVARCDTVSRELHATFVESSPGGSHALPPIAPPVAQPVTCQRPGTVKTVAANNLPKHHRDRSRDYAQTHNKTNNLMLIFPH